MLGFFAASPLGFTFALGALGLEPEALRLNLLALRFGLLALGFGPLALFFGLLPLRFKLLPLVVDATLLLLEPLTFCLLRA